MTINSLRQKKTRVLFLILAFLFFSFSKIIAQNNVNSDKILRYDFATDVTFLAQNNQTLSLALAGGLNSPQFSTIDLNGDSKNDLFVFDRTAKRIFTFLNQNNRYEYAPEYEILFPQIENWCLLIDYDNDGKKDIFTQNNFVVTVYKNISAPNNLVSFSTNSKNLTTKNIAGTAFINIGIDATDVPAITDIDNDGDIDILFFTPSFGVNVEFAKNMSIEKYGKADSLVFEKVSTRWGNFEECSKCNEYKFGNQSCFAAQKDYFKDTISNDDKANNEKQLKKDKNNSQTLRTEHSGSSQLVLDLDGNGLKDMLIGDVSCNNLAAFFNKGTQQEANFDAFMQNFPQNNPVNIYVFPAAYYEDVDFDGINDLLVAPNIADNSDKLTNFRKSISFYKNSGTNTKPNFNFIANDFLQSQMIDVGENAKPTTIDIDTDGDLDLLLTNAGSLQTDNSFKTQVFYYENIGTNQIPSFILRNENLWNFLNINGLYLKISFADLNNDKALDLIFSIATQQNVTSFQYVLNENLPNQALNFDLTKRKVLSLNSNIRPYDEPLFVDINNDTKVDLLIGRLAGNLEYWENISNFDVIGDISFVLRNASAGGITTNSNKISLSLAVADLTNDNKLELITGDASGMIKVYENFTDILTNNTTNVSFKEISRIIRNKITVSQQNHALGRTVCPAILGKDILLGTNTGGLHYLRFIDVITGIDDTNLANPALSFELQIFPNPANHTINLKSNKNLVIKLSNILGQFTDFFITLQAGESLSWNIENLAKGLYLLHSTDNKGNNKISKIVIE